MSNEKKFTSCLFNRYTLSLIFAAGFDLYKLEPSNFNEFAIGTGVTSLVIWGVLWYFSKEDFVTEKQREKRENKEYNESKINRLIKYFEEFNEYQDKSVLYEALKTRQNPPLDYQAPDMNPYQNGGRVNSIINYHQGKRVDPQGFANLFRNTKSEPKLNTPIFPQLSRGDENTTPQYPQLEDGEGILEGIIVKD